MPHFHGGRFAGRVVVAGLDTRDARPAELAGTVATRLPGSGGPGRDDDRRRTRSPSGSRTSASPPARDLAARRARARRRRRAPPLGAQDGRALRRRAAARLPRLRAGARAAAAAARRADLAARPGRRRRCSSRRSSGSARRSSSPSTASRRALELATRVLFVDDGRLLLDAPHARGASSGSPRERPAYAGACPGDRPAPSTSRRDGASSRPQASRSPTAGRCPSLDGVDLERPARRDRRARGAERLRQDDAREARGRPARAAGRVGRAARPRRLPLAGSRPLPRRARRCSTRSRSRSAATPSGRAPRSSAFGLGWAAARHPRDLSSGERERLGVAAVAVAEPDLLVLDEPTRGLDPERKARARRLAGRTTPPRARRCSSRRTTATSRPTAASDFVLQQHKLEERDVAA